MIPPETLTAAEAETLLHRQAALQAEATAVLTELDLIDRLSHVGSVRQIGSSTLGLMVWRDIDLSVSGLTPEQAIDALRPVFVHPRVTQVRYLNEAGVYNPTGAALYERAYFQIFLDPGAGGEAWKLDLSFWLAEGLHPEPIHDAIARQVTSETRLAILWIKDRWCRLPSYHHGVSSLDIYEAVLQHGVRTPAQFNHYLLTHGKPTGCPVMLDHP